MSLVRLRDDAIARKEANGALVEIDGAIYFINQSGALVLEKCDGSRTISDIANELGFSRNDVASFIMWLKTRNIVEFRKERKKRYSIFQKDEPKVIENSASYPVRVSIAITNKCNLNCRHCYARANELRYKELSTEAILSIFDQFSDLRILDVFITGGEPLLRKDFFDLCEYGFKKGLPIVCSSNGVAINIKIAKKLKKVGFKRFQISLESTIEHIHDYIRGVKGSFRLAIRAIKNLKKVNIAPVIAMTLTKLNYKNATEMYKLAFRLGADSLRFQQFLPIGRGLWHKELFLTTEEYKQILLDMINAERKYKYKIKTVYQCPFVFFKEEKINEVLPISMGCDAGRLECHIEPNGDVYPCSGLVYPEFRIGNILETPLQKLWEKNKVLNKLRKIKLKGKCEFCGYRYHCGGGCRSIAYALTKDITLPDPRCNVVELNLNKIKNE
jgi:radical SAM protein with 4Fe4S-binding SPASM domain